MKKGIVNRPFIVITDLYVYVREYKLTYRIAMNMLSFCYACFISNFTECIILTASFHPTLVSMQVPALLLTYS